MYGYFQMLSFLISNRHAGTLFGLANSPSPPPILIFFYINQIKISKALSFFIFSVPYVMLTILLHIVSSIPCASACIRALFIHNGLDKARQCL